jgi:hypothetical protein
MIPWKDWRDVVAAELATLDNATQTAGKPIGCAMDAHGWSLQLLHDALERAQRTDNALEELCEKMRST